MSERNQNTSHVSVLIIMQVFWHADTVINMTAFAIAEIVASLILSLTAITGQTMRRKTRRKIRNLDFLSCLGSLGYMVCLGWLDFLDILG